MVVLDKNTNSFNVVLRDFSTNRGKIKVLNSIEDSSTYVFDFLITDVNKGIAEVSFVSNENETSLLDTVDFKYITNSVEEQKPYIFNIDKVRTYEQDMLLEDSPNAAMPVDVVPIPEIL